MPGQKVSLSPEEWQKVLEAHKGMFASAEEFGHWTPPPGVGYTAVITEVRTGYTRLRVHGVRVRVHGLHEEGSSRRGVRALHCDPV